MDLVGGLAATSGALSIAKTLKDIDKAYDVASYKAQITELIEKLSDARLSLIEAKSQLADKDERIKILERARENILATVEGDGGYSYPLNDKNEREGLPICPTCRAKSNAQYKLVRDVNVDQAKCPVCGTSFRPVTSYIPPSKNQGNETTEVDRFIADKAAKQERAYAALERINEGSWIDSRYR